MSNESDFDPYHKWLGIPPQHQPPNHYRLLGLETFESDREVIRAAAERQMAHVQSYKIGPQSELSQRLLNEIARAKVCLLDPSSKAEYDRALQPPTPSPQRPMTSSSSAPAAYVQSSPGIRVHTVRRRKRRTPSTAIALSVCFVAFLVLAGAIAFLTSSQTPFAERISTDQRVTTDRLPKNTKQRSVLPQQPPRRPALPKKPAARPVLPQRHRQKQPMPGAQQRPPGAKFAVPTPAQIQRARAAIHIEGHLTPQELLQAATEADNPWMRYVLYQMTIDAALREKDTKHLLATRISLQAVEAIIKQYDVVDPAALRAEVQNKLRVAARAGDAPVQRAPAAPAAIDSDTGLTMVDLPDRDGAKSAAISIAGKVEALKVQTHLRSRFKFTASAAPDGRSWTITDGRRALARLLCDERRRGSCEFSWAEGTSADADCLRNALLVVNSNASSIALRRTVEIEAPLVDLSSKQITLPVDVPLWGLSPRDLRIEAVGLSKVLVQARYPADGRADHQDPARLVIRDQTPKGGVELALYGTSPPRLRIKPVLEDFDGKLYPWTEDRMKNLEGAFVRRISKCQKDILGLKRGIPNLEARLAALNKQYHPNSLTASIIKSQINQVTASRDAAKRQLADLERTLPILNRQVKGFSELQELSGSIHQQARVAFRVFYVVAGHEVTVLRADF